MSRNSKVIALICGVVSVVVTIMFYLLTVENVFTKPIRYLSAVFLILSECIMTVKVMRMKKTVFGVANIIASGCQLFLVLIMSIIFVNLYPLCVGGFVFLNILVLCVMFVVDIIIGRFGEYRNEKDEAAGNCREIVDDLYVNAKELQTEYSGSGYEKELSTISEMLMYSDKSALTGDEAVISNELEELRELLSGGGNDIATSEISKNDEDILQKVSHIKNAIKRRSVKVKNSKRGGF